MKLLLDENLPKKLKSDFPEHEIYTVRDKSWNVKEHLNSGSITVGQIVIS
jgi:predicted nuclease of predicted toxin-antitoxin system